MIKKTPVVPTGKERMNMIKFNHFNFNVLDLDKSLAFYKEALGLEPVREKEPPTARLNWSTWGTA